MRPLLALAPLALAACASAQLIPDRDRAQLAAQFEGHTFYLRASVHVLPFFWDRTRRLVSLVPPDSIELLAEPSGEIILPGAPTGLLRQGKRVRVAKLEFPTGLTLARRPLYTPRELPWVYLEVLGEAPGETPYVAVLRPGMRTRGEYLAQLDQLLSERDPEEQMEGYSPEVREAVREKRLVREMDARALELAWGRPERIRQQLDQGVRIERWIWPLGKREATLRDGKLVDAVPPLQARASP